MQSHHHCPTTSPAHPTLPTHALRTNSLEHAQPLLAGAGQQDGAAHTLPARQGLRHERLIDSEVKDVVGRFKHEQAAVGEVEVICIWQSARALEWCTCGSAAADDGCWQAVAHHRWLAMPRSPTGRHVHVAPLTVAECFPRVAAEGEAAVLAPKVIVLVDPERLRSW